jgi:pyrroloquinoline quinone biosynthesis protein B
MKKRSIPLIHSCLAILFAILLTGCAPNQTSLSGPRLRVLGIAQDGGLPHAACWCRNCRAAREAQPRNKTCVASLALILPQASGRSSIYLIDATPDIRTQLDMLSDLRPPPPEGVGRTPVDGVFLTHAHIGHYLGLAFFGFEAINTKDLLVYCTPRMAAFLRNNGPWSQLVRIGNIAIHETPPGSRITLPYEFAGTHDEIAISSIAVPHRDEYSDTMAYIFRRSGSEQSPAIMYLPDTEPWPTWNPSLLDVIKREHVRTLLLDGTFFSAEDLPGRRATSIGHPLMKDSMGLLEPLVRQGKLDVFFTHLNHSNPALDPTSAASREIKGRGFHVATEGQQFVLTD